MKALTIAARDTRLTIHTGSRQHTSNLYNELREARILPEHTEVINKGLLRRTLTVSTTSVRHNNSIENLEVAEYICEQYASKHNVPLNRC